MCIRDRVCTCPSRGLIQASIYDGFLADGIERVRAVKQGDPLDDTTMMGAQASNDQFEKILSYIDIGRQEGATVLTGGSGSTSVGTCPGGTTVSYTHLDVYKRQGHRPRRAPTARPTASGWASWWARRSGSARCSRPVAWCRARCRR